METCVKILLVGNFSANRRGNYDIQFRRLHAGHIPVAGEVKTAGWQSKVVLCTSSNMSSVW